MIRKIGAAILSGDGQSLLVVRKRGRDVFMLPGGRPEDGERPTETLQRELEEELSARAAEATYLMAVEDVSVFDDEALEMDVYSVVLDQQPRASSEIVELAYVGSDWRSSGLRLASGVTDHVLPRLLTTGGIGRSEQKLGAVAVLFSGGRDSTAVADDLHRAGFTTHLLSFSSGLGRDDGLLALREAELRQHWANGTYRFHKLQIAGLVRQICFRDIVDDILTDQRQLILLGEAVAMLVRAIQYCRDQGIGRLAIGATAYQAQFPEQRPETLRAFAALCAEFDIEFLTPGSGWSSESQVKERLWLAGLSTKSLESSSLLADLDDHPPAGVVARYLERKLDWAGSFLRTP